MEMKKVKINDITIRDIFQNIDARFINEKILSRIVEHISKVKFDSLEVFGGSAFEKMLESTLGKTPFEIIYKIKSKFPSVSLQALVGARNLVGTEVYAFPVIKKFVRQCIKSGVSRFRVFDSLNDIGNSKYIISEIIENNSQCQGTIIYDNLKEIDFYTDISDKLIKSGCSSICIKDVESTLLPHRVKELFDNLTALTDKPFYLSLYNLRGLQVSNYYNACISGCKGVDLSFIPSSYNDLSPAIFPLILSLKDTEMDLDLDYLKMLELFEWFRQNIYPMIRNDLLHSRLLFSNKNQNLLPKWLLSSIHNQLNEIGESNKIDLVLEEVFKIKNEIGNPSLATPVGQIIGSQAILNTIISDYRWEIINDEIKKLISGYYGRLPREVDQKIYEITGFQDRAEQLAVKADPDDKTFEQCADEIKNLSKRDEDILSYIFFPEKAVELLERRKYPADERQNGKTIPASIQEFKFPEYLESKQQVKFEDIDLKKMREITNLVETSNIDEIKLEIDGVKISFHKKPKAHSENNLKIQPFQTYSLKTDETISEKESQSKEVIIQEKSLEKLLEIRSPIVGTFYSSPSPEATPFVKIGSKIKKGETLCIIEAMKLMNKINSDFDGEITEILVQNEEAVEYNQIIMRIKP